MYMYMCVCVYIYTYRERANFALNLLDIMYTCGIAYF